MAGNGIVEVTDANFDSDVLKSDKPVLIDFWAGMVWAPAERSLQSSKSSPANIRAK